MQVCEVCLLCHTFNAQSRRRTNATGIYNFTTTCERYLFTLIVYLNVVQ